MKISYNWLLSYFEKPLPVPEVIGGLLTMHAFEIDSIDPVGSDFLLDVKVLPDRSHDCLSHIGIAREVSMLGGYALKQDIFPKDLQAPESNSVQGDIEDHSLCRRLSLLVIENIEVRESPQWLKDLLAAIGQRSINNVVDATNYVMFALGQPLHAYDRDMLTDNGGFSLGVRKAREGEVVEVLGGKQHALSPDILVITDENAAGSPAIGIAGIKGGKASEITKNTKHIIVESANFDPVFIRKAAKNLGLRTDASVRFENGITPEFTTKALDMVHALIVEIAGTEHTQVEGVCDIYPRKAQPYTIGVSLGDMKSILGVTLSEKELEELLDKRGYPWKKVSPREEIVRRARELIGVPYKYGASVSFDAPSAFDCSSFTAYVYAQAGIGIPRISIDQYVYGEPITLEELQPGDLIFFNTHAGTIHTESKEFLKGTSVPAGIDHVGICVEDKKVLHASMTAQSVIEEPLDEIISRGVDMVGYGTVKDVTRDRYVISVPPYRLDLRSTADLTEEYGRIFGYQNITPNPISSSNTSSFDAASFYCDSVRDELVRMGFSEVKTYVFQDHGDIELQNPLAQDKKFLRSSFNYSHVSAVEKNGSNMDLLGLKDIRLFEIGTLFFSEAEEKLVLGVSYWTAKGREAGKNKEIFDTVTLKVAEVFGVSKERVEQCARGTSDVLEITLDSLIKDAPNAPKYVPYISAQVLYQPFSPYPVITRDVALFAPDGLDEDGIRTLLEENGGNLLVRVDLFDTFQKTFPDGTQKTSFAFRLVFQSKEKTLTDDEVSVYMEGVKKALENASCEIR